MVRSSISSKQTNSMQLVCVCVCTSLIITQHCSCTHSISRSIAINVAQFHNHRLRLKIPRSVLSAGGPTPSPLESTKDSTQMEEPPQLFAKNGFCGSGCILVLSRWAEGFRTPVGRLWTGPTTVIFSTLALCQYFGRGGSHPCEWASVHIVECVRIHLIVSNPCFICRAKWIISPVHRAWTVPSSTWSDAIAGRVSTPISVHCNLHIVQLRG